MELLLQNTTQNVVNRVLAKVAAFRNDNRGISVVVEILLIAAVMVALCAIFKTQGSTLITTVFGKVTTAIEGLFSVS